MGDFKQFVLQEWHIIALFVTLLGGIFKSEISSALTAIVIIIEQRELVGQSVQVQSPDGSWQAVEIISYHYEIPVWRTGGVMIMHQSVQDEYVQEKINFDIWKNMRVRTVQS